MEAAGTVLNPQINMRFIGFKIGLCYIKPIGLIFMNLVYEYYCVGKSGGQ